MSEPSPYQSPDGRPTIGPSDMTAEEFEQLAEMVADALVNGDDRDAVIADLTNSGWKSEEAHGFVNYIEDQMFAAQHVSQGSGEGAFGWLIWIGVIIGINVLSHIFNWGFTIF